MANNILFYINIFYSGLLLIIFMSISTSKNWILNKLENNNNNMVIINIVNILRINILVMIILSYFNINYCLDRNNISTIINDNMILHMRFFAMPIM